MSYYDHAVILGAALDAAGPDLNRDSLMAGFASLNAFDSGGLPPVTFGTGALGSPGFFPLQCCNSDRTWKGLGPAATSF
jgi:hypothetical protein